MRHEWWCGDGFLKDAFLDFYGITQNKAATVADYMCWRVGSLFWDITFLRSLHDWKLEEMATIMDHLYSTKVRRDVADQICWRVPNNGIFAVKSFYRVLHTGGGLAFPWKSIWRV